MIYQTPIRNRRQWLALRQQDVTASVAGALLGTHDFTTAYGLWALKTHRIDEDVEENPAMRRGRLLEPVVVAMLKEDYPRWKARNPKVYLRDEAIRLGATPDLYVDCPDRGPGIVQIKTTSSSIFAQKWVDQETGEIVPPLWIAIQAIVEATLSGREWADVAALVIGYGGTLDVKLVPVPLHAGVMDRIRQAVVEFWALVASGREPDPDYGRDSSLIDRVYAEDDGGEIDLSGDPRVRSLAATYTAMRTAEAEAMAAKESAAAEIKARLGKAAVAYIGGGHWITWKTSRRVDEQFRVSTRRTLRVPDVPFEAETTANPKGGF